MAGRYFATKKEIDGITFDSTDESKYYVYLKMKKAAHVIKDFSLQPKYELLPAFKKDGKSYQKITYSPDFLVTNLDDSIELIDVKGFTTQQGELRRKMFNYKYPDITLTWVGMSIKFGDENGIIEWGLLKKKRAAAKKLINDAKKLANGGVLPVKVKKVVKPKAKKVAVKKIKKAVVKKTKI